MATHSNILAWRIPRTDESGGLQFMACKELDMTKRLNNNNKISSMNYWPKGISKPNLRMYHHVPISVRFENLLIMFRHVNVFYLHKFSIFLNANFLNTMPIQSIMFKLISNALKSSKYFNLIFLLQNKIIFSSKPVTIKR